MRSYFGLPRSLLEAHKNKSSDRTQFNLNEKASVSQVALGGLPSGSLLRDRESWYPTVRKMVWVLEQLRDFVQVMLLFLSLASHRLTCVYDTQPAIFEDIAQEAIQLCHQSLITASENIKARKGSAGALDGSLFLLRHLLVLKEVIGDFELGGGSSGVAGSSTTLGLVGGGVTGKFLLVQEEWVCRLTDLFSDTLANLLTRTSGLLPLPQGLFGTLGVGAHGERGDLRYVCRIPFATLKQRSDLKPATATEH